MINKNTISSSIPVLNDIAEAKSTAPAESRWPGMLQKVWLYLRGENKGKTAVPDPAAAVIAEIEDREVAAIVKDLHYRTPKSLKAMRNACEQCFELPDDCPYYDYSIFDVKKAIKKLEAQPEHTFPLVVEELSRINRELAYHISEYLE